MYLKSLRFRLISIYAATFIFGTLALYIVTYLLLSSSFIQDERMLLRSKLLEYWAVYNNGRSAALESEMNFEQQIGSVSAPYYVRVADRENKTVLLAGPSTWSEYPFEELPVNNDGQSGSFNYIKSGPGGHGLLYETVPMFDGYYLQVGIGSGRRAELLGRLRRVFLMISIPFILLGTAMGWLAASRATAPVKKLSTMSRFIIETGSLSRRIPRTGSRDELDELIGLFNRMVETIESLVDNMRRSLDDVAHDLRTPLTRLRMRAEDALLDKCPPEERKEALQAIIGETEQMLTILQMLMDISEAESGIMRLDRGHVDIGEVLRDISELYSYTADDKHIEFSVAIDPNLFVDVDVNRMRQVFANLLDNAMKYTFEGGSVYVRGSAEAGVVKIEIEDTGIGIDPKDIPRIWDRLFRADRSRSNPGFGLGLGLVKAIVEAHDGSVGVESELDKGSIFSVMLPQNASDRITQRTPAAS